MRIRAALAPTLALALLPRVIEARPAPSVPAELAPWKDWALHGHEREACPQLPELADTCAWPARLDLTLDEAGGRFTQEWFVLARSAVSLPGSAEAWPQDARVDGAPLAVTARAGDPVAWLDAGAHRITGTLRWQRLPESLRVPASTGLVSLTVGGRAVPSPSRDAEGRLWLQAGAAVTEAAESLTVAVHRRVTDEVPLQLESRLTLDVSGRARELTLGPVLPEGFLPLALDAPLPARLDPDGKLRIQVRPGRWFVTLVARHVGPAASLAAPAAGENWSPDEVWCFAARPDLRVVTVEGVPAIDPQQTAMPEEWKSLPTFRLLPGETMRFDEKQRGDAEPSPDQLTLHRELWLDFDGQGLTARDQLGGLLSRSWRLESQPPWDLGRASVGGQEQLLTRRAPGAAPGLEIRQGQAAVEADARIEGPARSVPAVGWAADVSSLSATLQLPPGWRLLAAPGADIASGTWISHWTLLDLFLALIVTIAVFRLWGWPAGALALATMTLTVTEPGAPKWAWLFVVSLEAICRVLKSGTALRVAQVARALVLAFVVIVAVGFMLVEARNALYPQLENPWRIGGWSALLASGATPSMPGAEAGAVAGLEMRAAEAQMKASAQVGLAAPVVSAEDQRPPQRTHDPSEIVQTGPGVPAWRWRAMELSWSGPVEQAQQVRLILLPPWGTSLLGFLRVVLLTALTLLAVLPQGGAGSLLQRLRRRGSGDPPSPGANTPPSPGATLSSLPWLIAALAAAGASAPASARAEVPPAEVLDQLRERLLAPPECAPDCAQALRLALDADTSSARVRLEVSAAAAWPLALPGAEGQWIASTVLLDGQPARALARSSDGLTWLLVPEGVHQVWMEGPLPARDVVSIPLPSRPREATATARGWVVTGIHDGRSEDTLQLAREQARPAADGDELVPAVLPTFVMVTRHLDLGLTWSVFTHVQRASQSAAPIVVRVPLLPGESVTTADVRVEEGRALVTLGPGVSGIAWRSTLAETPSLQLEAPQTTEWAEVWRLDASPSWHVEPAGVPPVHQPAQALRVREWRPWPGETVSLAISRPEAVQGPSLTVDASTLALVPGLRATDATLTLSIRSSRGGQHEVVLPEGAEIQSLSVGGLVQPARQDGRLVSIAITPGSQEVVLGWREPRGLSLRWRSSGVDLRAPSVNDTLEVTLPRRWVLHAHGPRLGPAVLFWSLLAVIVLLAAIMSAWKVTPLRFASWLLLFVGLSQVPAWMGAIVVAWLLLLAWRGHDALRLAPAWRNVVQVVIVLWTVVALIILFTSIHQGLLGDPRMQVAGNGSNAQLLRWTADHAEGPLPVATVLSAPLLAYRLAMLAWALWLAAALIGWFRWGWDRFTTGGAWHHVHLSKMHGQAPPPPPPPAPPAAG